MLKIESKSLKIKLKRKINELNEYELKRLYCLIFTFNKLEKNNGNEFEKAFIKIKYETWTEYLNIFNLIRKPNLYDFITYFSKIKEKICEQGTETKININDYINNIEEGTSQDIIITMVFEIESKKEKMIELTNKMIKTLLIEDEIEKLI